MAGAGRKLEDHRVESRFKKEFYQVLHPGDSVLVSVQRNHTAISQLTMEMDAIDMAQALRSVVLKASFDGYQTIWAPVGDFFGTGYSLNPHQSWMNHRNDRGHMESLWLMPFRDSCQLVVINHSEFPVGVKGSIGLKSYKWSSNSMYFGTSWHEYHKIQSRDDKGSPFDLNFVDIKGKGVYAGDQVTLYNSTYQWWGEGDEKIFVDGEKFPSSFGTGSEDYYGYSFARSEPFSHPFVCQPDGTGNTSRGLTVNMRHRSLDAIPFHSTISSNIELWHWANVTINVALTAYWYVSVPFEINIAPNVQSVQFPVMPLNKEIEE